jgi:hypothetical protein
VTDLVGYSKPAKTLGIKQLVLGDFSAARIRFLSGKEFPVALIVLIRVLILFDSRVSARLSMLS